MEAIIEELCIPKKYVRSTCRDDRFIAWVQKSWLRNLLKKSKHIDPLEKPSPLDPDSDTTRIKIIIRIFKKRDAQVIPLPKIHPKTSRTKDALTLSQLMQHINQTNHKNLWKEAYKKHHDSENSGKNTQVNLVDYNDVLREVIVRVYGCRIVMLCDAGCVDAIDVDTPRNLYPVICGVESINAIYLLHTPFIEHTVKDCVTFSPAVLNQCYTKPLFLIYQLLNALKELHERSLTIGDVTLQDIYISDDLFIYIFPQLQSNIYVQDIPKPESSGKYYDCRKLGHKLTNHVCINCGSKSYDNVQVSNESLEKLCELWIHNQISNYTYLMCLNNLSGRRYGDPNCHYVFPWVTDFTSPCGKNWRDLKKSKYRLNKGDRQLDLTYETQSSLQPPHHVSDVLSSITYYVYMSRRTPKEVLCKNVRTVWVPAEYPSSVQRLQEWTPDECAPEFFSDPTVFKSVHEDLGDLEVPNWCIDAEDFVERHREALESQHVSERLHYWIDLTFGYRLAGSAAVKAKNVCLQLVDGHTNLTRSGVVQLFSHPHPPKATNLPFSGKTPPKLFFQKVKSSRDHSSSSSNATNVSLDTSRTSEEDETATDDSKSPLALSKFLSRSRSSLNDELKDTSGKKSRNNLGTQRSASLGPKSTFTSHLSAIRNNGVIHLPKEYNPAQALINLENLHGFFSKTFCREEGKRVGIEGDVEKVVDDNVVVKNAFINRVFDRETVKSFTFPVEARSYKKNKENVNQVVCNYAEIIASRRVRELQILGCLIVEIFMAGNLRALGSASGRKYQNVNISLKQRLKQCLTILKSNNAELIPSCVRCIINLLLLNGENEKYPAVTELGLPPPTAYLLLEPLLHFVIPFNENFPVLYKLVAGLKEFDEVTEELNILYYFDCSGERCAEYESLERTRLVLMQNMSECKVKACALHLDQLLDDINYVKDSEVINLLIPYIKNLIESPPTSVLAAWYLFDPLSRHLGPKKSSEVLLAPILKLYETEPSDINIPYFRKVTKLYHHSFLLRLIVRFSLKCFLEHFITPLVEAVGGYRDHDRLDFVPHSHVHSETTRKPLKSMDRPTDNIDLSPDDSSSSERNIPEPEIFQFDTEESTDPPSKQILQKLELNLTTDLPFNHSSAEEAVDVAKNLESEYELKQSDLLNITCDIGSKIESPEIPVPTKSYAASPLNGKESKISTMSADSLIWLSHRLGPVLTARHLSRNLLKMLTLCFVGKENLEGVSPDEDSGEMFIGIAESRVVGDRSAAKVLDCLASIAALYGEQLILLQYLPHMSELIALCKRRLTPNLEGGLISCLALLKHIIPYISDGTLMDHLQETVLKNIMYPTIRLLGSTKYTFPNGSVARNVLAHKYLDTLYILSLRIGADMTRTHLAVPALQRFFLIFDKIGENHSAFFQKQQSNKEQEKPSVTTAKTDDHFLEVRRDGTIAEWAIGGRPVQISHVRLKDTDSTDSISPPRSYNKTSTTNADETGHQALEEMQSVFTAELAFTAYMPFLRQIGEHSLQQSLKNYENIHNLCHEHESNLNKPKQPYLVPHAEPQSTETQSSSIGSNVALIGNRIDVQETQSDILNFISNKMDNNVRHLRGNWLAYWEHEIGRSEKDTMFNFKQIKLQTFVGHNQTVKSLYVLDNENSFLSGSKDKTVKLWSLRSIGDGTHVSSCQSTYTAHKKSVLGITFLESLRLVASCDNMVHLWDPFMGASVGQLETTRFAPVTIIKSLPAPSPLLFAGTSDGYLRVIDARICSYIHELKVTVNPAGLVRCLAISPSGNWIATGQSSGQITVLDTRTGLVLSTWRAHEGELLQLVALNEETLISSSLDQTLMVWSIQSGTLKFPLKGASEPVHCLNAYNDELISGTTGNRIGVHTSVQMDASFSSTKLRSDTFKGIMTSMVVLPLNRLLLLGADTGNIHLLC